MTATWEPSEAPDATTPPAPAEPSGTVGPAPAGEAGPPDAPAGSGAPEATAERARDGLEHLQAAARELIAAARAALDVAEDIVDDPSIVKDLTEARSSRSARSAGSAGPARATSWLEGVASLAGALGPLGELVRNATSGRPDPGPTGPNGHGHDPGEAGGNAAAADPAVIERIIVR